MFLALFWGHPDSVFSNLPPPEPKHRFLCFVSILEPLSIVQKNRAPNVQTLACSLVKFYSVFRCRPSLQRRLTSFIPTWPGSPNLQTLACSPVEFYSVFCIALECQGVPKLSSGFWQGESEGGPGAPMYKPLLVHWSSSIVLFAVRGPRGPSRPPYGASKHPNRPP